MCAPPSPDWVLNFFFFLRQGLILYSILLWSDIHVQRSWPGSLLGAEIRSKCHTWLLLPLFFYPTEFMWMCCVLTLFALFVIAILVFQTVNNDYWRVVIPWKIWCIRSESCVHRTLRRGFCVFLFFQWCTSRAGFVYRLGQRSSVVGNRPRTCVDRMCIWVVIDLLSCR